MERRVTDEVTIRPIEGDEEIRACAELMVSSEPWRSLGRTMDEATAILGSSRREVYVAVSEGRPVGFAVLVLRGLMVGSVQSLAVLPELRGKGIGTAIMKFVERRIFEDFPNVFLAVAKTNWRARRFYEFLGYQAFGELEDLLIRGETEVLMRKTLGPLAEFDEEKRIRAESS